MPSPRAFGVAEMPGGSAGEGAAFVPEQLALQEVLGDGGAVHGDEWSWFRTSQPLQVARADLLADARLPGQQHWCRMRGDAPQHLLDAEHLRGDPKHGRAAVLCRSQQLFDPSEEARHLEWLCHVVTGTVAHQPDRLVDLAIGGDEKEWRRCRGRRTRRGTRPRRCRQEAGCRRRRDPA